MGAYCHLYVSDYPIYSSKGEVYPVIMTIFRENDKRVFERRVSERNPLTWGEIEDTGEIEMVYEYTNSVAQIKERLNIMGFSLQKVRQDFDSVKQQEIERLKEWGAEEEGFLWYEELHILEGASFDDYISAFKEILDRKLRPQLFRNDLPITEKPLIRYILGPNDDEFYYHFPCSDIRCFFRSFLEVWENDLLVTLDLTELVLEGYYEPDEPVCEFSIEQLTHDYPINEKIIILTEGSTDKNILERSLHLLYPDLDQYYSFMDFGVSNASGSAGSLVSTIKAFVGSGIANRIIAIFDNDTGAQVAMKGLKKTNIPENIKVLRYPNLQFAESYPTLGPSGISELNINGLACSIELYFGIDVLNQNSQLVPIHWKGYDTSVNQYQGEIMKKQELQDIFFKKLTKCEKDPSLIECTDWSSIRAILSEIFLAFQ